MSHFQQVLLFSPRKKVSLPSSIFLDQKLGEEEGENKELFLSAFVTCSLSL